MLVSTSEWFSRVPLTSRNSPPAARIRSRHENVDAEHRDEGCRSEMMKVMVNSSRTRRTIAIVRPRRRAGTCCFFGRCSDTIARNTILSMPSTISSTANVARLIHTLGSVRSSSIGTRCQNQAGECAGTQEKRLPGRNDTDGRADHDITREMHGQHRARARETERKVNHTGPSAGAAVPTSPRRRSSARGRTGTSRIVAAT